MRSSPRYAKHRGGPPTVIGWPFAKVSINDDVLVFSSGRLIPGRVAWEVSRSQIQRVEPTQRGVRFFGDGIDGPWGVASLFPKRLLSKVRTGGIEPNGPLAPSTWNTI
jgi:hypothetical protein